MDRDWWLGYLFLFGLQGAKNTDVLKIFGCTRNPKQFPRNLGPRVNMIHFNTHWQAVWIGTLCAYHQ